TTGAIDLGAQVFVFALQALLAVDAAQGAHGARDFAGGVVVRSRFDDYPTRLSVFRHQLMLVVLLGAGEPLLQAALHRVPVFRRGEDFVTHAAQQFFGRPAGELLHARVGVEDAALLVGDDDAFVEAVEDRAVEIFALAVDRGQRARTGPMRFRAE